MVSEAFLSFTSIVQEHSKDLLADVPQVIDFESEANLEVRFTDHQGCFLAFGWVQYRQLFELASKLKVESSEGLDSVEGAFGLEVNLFQAIAIIAEIADLLVQHFG